ncbi:Uncharacterized protein BCZB5J_02987 [Bacillus cereus]|uniref:DUF4489 domain-containing protein n=1 Tax=Bacillus wiedmannii TaxID=1890302 RepID=UPI0008175A25|nr:DUF4489 domain-containing protein [Bacillus wiedmannii]SCC39729.1 Uncharacterized protein BCZB5J_02987 [Bacillus cereus]SCN36156.1 Uncharacterized protein BCRIVMBC938_03306 [Bacillus wiedmannii]
MTNSWCHGNKKHSNFKPQPIALFCGESTGNGRRIDGDLRDERVQLGRVTVDTSGLHHPTIKIEFSTNVKFEEVDRENMLAQARVRYDLYKQCKGQEYPVVLDSWFYERNLRLNDAGDFIDTTDIISFHYCTSCDVECYDCCDYYVVASIEAINGAAVTYLHSEISAFVQDSVFCTDSNNKSRY